MTLEQNQPQWRVKEPGDIGGKIWAIRKALASYEPELEKVFLEVLATEKARWLKEMREKVDELFIDFAKIPSPTRFDLTDGDIGHMNGTNDTVALVLSLLQEETK